MAALEALAEKDPRVMLVTCDVGFSYLEEFAKKFPKQYRNVGVCEQFATGYCAGLAADGAKPFFYSMIPFVTMRNYEYLRNDLCHANRNVVLVGIQGSTGYQFLGVSHNIGKDEDKKILRHLPNLKMWVPKTPRGIEMAVSYAYRSEGPSYIRLS